jgi:hypothetical protein
MPADFPMFDAPYVLVDLDDTLAHFKGYKGWRHIGPPRPYAQQFLRWFKKYDWKVIIWTARAEVGYIEDWLHNHSFYTEPGIEAHENGVPAWDYINASPMNAIKGCNPTKPLADLIIDNAAYPFCGRPVPLKKVIRFLLRNKILQNTGAVWGSKINNPRKRPSK